MVVVSVIGAGLLGTKIAGELAQNGHTVRVWDQSSKQLDKLQEKIKYDQEQLFADNLLMHKTFLGEIYCFNMLEECVQDTNYVFEAIEEDLEQKKLLFERISHCCKSTTIISSNSLNINIDNIVEKTAYKERTIGIRFLFPVYCIPEVELTKGKYTSIKTIEKVLNFLERIGKTGYFRSAKEPLILNEDQRNYRREQRKQYLKLHRGLGGKRKYYLPELAHAGNFAPPQDDITARKERQEEECIICMDEKRQCILSPCHHLCTCYECAELLVNRHDSCPICRKPIREAIKFYRS